MSIWEFLFRAFVVFVIVCLIVKGFAALDYKLLKFAQKSNATIQKQN